ncbi:YheC/YheD family protein [Ammoniphilus sp. CFH 90114]|uniref:YheC/YheD family protein n=1 Tax=Ammoniphilus sp. CFH 90114 TaxID=2493665 RepID=UPI00100E85A5|nr:YheC/YheD family protein [Ammoniphilus sp. CFH 90114]RXT13997.1 hypothetical protein EIZ39_07635 [Ammoniphilus sp. CFH 90114]
MQKQRYIASKMKKTKPLVLDPILSKYLPETTWFSPSNLETMLEKYSTIYIKPDRGNKGRGITRLKVLNDWEYEVSYRKIVKNLRPSEAIQEVLSNMNPSKKYIIQQGIDVATYQGRPFDLRVIMQRPANQWQLTFMYARVANNINAHVTNVARGSTRVTIQDLFSNIDCTLVNVRTIQEIVDISHRIVNILSNRYALWIVGLDIAIDKNGEIWLIEPNFDPLCGGLKALKDEVSYQKYQEAKRMLSESGKKC